MKKILVYVVSAVLSTALISCKQENPHVLLQTEKGDIKIELFENKSPVTVDNFLKYTEAGFYDETVFHQVIEDFMVKAGGFTTDFDEKDPLYPPIENEADNGLSNLRSTVAMDRTHEINSATSEFFINLGNNNILDHGGKDFGYCVFGRVVEGMDVIEKIGSVDTHSRDDLTDVPVEPVKILSATVLK